MVFRFMLVLFSGLFLSAAVQAQSPAPPRTDALGDPLPAGAIARLGTLRLKHNLYGEQDFFGRGNFFTTINNAIFSPDGKKIVSFAQPYGSIRVWDAVTGKLQSSPLSSNQELHITRAAALSQDGAILALSGTYYTRMGMADNAFTLWDLAAGKPIRTFSSALASAQAVCFADGGKSLVAAGGDTVRWWDVEKGTQLRSWQPLPNEKPPTPAAGKKGRTQFNYFFGPGAKSMAVQVGRFGEEKGAPPDNEIFFFDLSNGDKPGRMIGRAKMAMNGASRVVFSADGKRVSYAKGPAQVDVRDTVTGKLIAAPALEGKFLRNNFIGGLALSSDGSMLAVCDGNAHVSLYNTNDTKSSRDFQRAREPGGSVLHAGRPGLFSGQQDSRDRCRQRRPALRC